MILGRFTYFVNCLPRPLIHSTYIVFQYSFYGNFILGPRFILLSYKRGLGEPSEALQQREGKQPHTFYWPQRSFNLPLINHDQLNSGDLAALPQCLPKRVFSKNVLYVTRGEHFKDSFDCRHRVNARHMTNQTMFPTLYNVLHHLLPSPGV